LNSAQEESDDKRNLQDAEQHVAHQHKADQQLQQQRPDSDGRSSAAQCVQRNSSSNSSRSSSGMMWDVPAEEEAFLRSLGWTSVESDGEEEWGLTEEEIAAFRASAAARAAAQQMTQQSQQQSQQYDLFGSGCQQQQLHVNGHQGVRFAAAKALHGPGGVLWGTAGTAGGAVANAGAGFALKSGAAAAGAAGLLLGVHLAPELLGYDSCGDSSSSSSDDEDEVGSAARHGMVY
jgi:hypothetical protein